MNKQDLADRVKTLREDEVLAYVIRGIKDDATTIFTNPHSDDEKVLEAHQAIQAVGFLENAFDAIAADAQINRES
jgi:hypothetical protein